MRSHSHIRVPFGRWSVVVASAILLAGVLAARPAMSWLHLHAFAAEAVQAAAHPHECPPSTGHPHGPHNPSGCGTCFELLLAKFVAAFAETAPVAVGFTAWPAAACAPSVPKTAPDVTEAPPRGPPILASDASRA